MDASGAGGALDEDGSDLGRQTIRVTIERARSTGTLNLSSRALKCIPISLFEIHLGIKPEPLSLVSEADADPGVTTAELRRRAKQQEGGQPVSWFEAQDLQVVKARSNEIVELHPEISLFGSLRIIDVRPSRRLRLFILSNLSTYSYTTTPFRPSQ